MTTHKYLIKCKKCTKPMSIVELYFTRGTDILFWVLCVKCGIDEERRADFLDIQADIRKCDGLTIIDGNETIN